MKNSRTISEIKDLLKQDVNDDILEELAADERKGVQKLLVAYQKKIVAKQQLIEKFHQKEHLEHPYWERGQYVAGVDEVGRGPLAGPVVTAAVVLPPDNTLYEVDDSKKLSIAKRNELYKLICQQAIDISVAVGSPRLIDTENIYHATELVMADAINNLYLKPSHILVDAMTIPVNVSQTKLIKGDSKSLTIGAASIVAKVARDRLMQEYDRIYPEFDFIHNDGYGTRKHLDALEKYGKTSIHRESFAPVKNIHKSYQTPLT
ncbi:ribonuclease HII [Companilactobacillus sp.]|jgi:ribonuclease HII|uniref:ribonuclease HII n=1 Tax=Companilactobacillus sp. TaxID=2767905 RepID=UPI0025C6D297|nr:ribonuclease HII [Companilactobacillus sp.]MCH4008297.1 ribonuclease HII [Companilactobacillus sp.]MCH4051524.1 ribonuclease HII [Companilactobacillus sp.]MCH4076240.1 ribonuclease HII [Companilactobacillus sp.]MCH4124815.1 ribonuclease HII [Companilactobacillus sp.]MCH4131357.1 ribonuclease HII [Companilactobacillus sp.]